MIKLVLDHSDLQVRPEILMAFIDGVNREEPMYMEQIITALAKSALVIYREVDVPFVANWTWYNNYQIDIDVWHVGGALPMLLRLNKLGCLIYERERLDLDFASFKKLVRFLHEHKENELLDFVLNLTE